MRANAFQAIAHISELNELKRAILHGAAPVSKEEILRGFKSCGIPSNEAFWSQFLASGLLVKVEGNFYVWKTKHPIHHRMLQAIYLKYQHKINSYARTYKEKKAKLQAAKDKEIDEAINLLKDKGFEIFVPYKGLYKKL